MKNGTLLTPPLVSSVLPGITRDTVVQLARRLRDPGARKRALPREMLYICGRGLHDRHRGRDHPRAVRGQDHDRQGARGPVTEALQKAFFDVIECRVPDEYGWLTLVRDVSAAAPCGARRSTAG